MLKKDELKVLKALLEDLSKEYSLLALSRLLKQQYFQTYRTVHQLKTAEEIKIKQVGKSRIVQLDWTKNHLNYLLAEIERTNDFCKKTKFKLLREDTQNIGKNFICLLFGSQAKTPKTSSDIDLLFIIPKEYDSDLFEKEVKAKLLYSNLDISIIPEESLHEMWSYPAKFNLGNELLKKHIILYGAEHFLNLFRKHHVG